ncbi:hypothetical protein KKF60_00680 [Patescibacteria group bacterium]|nr:hypothetical protein [Patescibacteria group bacterium]MBU4458414.1 hypothetical protein [Patescibacteria group bacterium]MCG2695831.1 hypothetical protein [Candidatus Portnoybacteria bacterium]
MIDINLIPKEYKKRGISLAGILSKTGGIILGLLILSLLTYGGLFFYQKSVKDELKGIIQEITNLESKRDSVKEELIVGADKKLDIVENLFKEHLYWSKLFSKIEELIDINVYFSESKFSFENEKVNILLAGSARSYTALAQQMVSFKEDPLVEKVAVSDIALSEIGGVKFNLSITFSKEILLSETKENK